MLKCGGYKQVYLVYEWMPDPVESETWCFSEKIPWIIESCKKKEWKVKEAG